MTLQAAIQSVIDVALEQDPEFAARWYAECERQLRDLGRTLPTQGIESTWSKVKGALQQNTAPDVVEAAMERSLLSANAGSTGADLSGLTVQTPCPAALPLGGRVLEGGR